MDFVSSLKRQQLYQEFHDRIKRVDPRSNYLSTVESRWDGEKSDALEREWLSSLVALYAFSEKHSKEMVLHKGQLVFADAALAEDF